MDGLQAIYERFSARACGDYRWEHQPIPFNQLKSALLNRLVHGYVVEDTGLPEPVVGFMLYLQEEHRAIEINVIYSELDDHKTVLDRLMRLFIPDILAMEGWDVVSYAMLGAQEPFIRTITWYGFKPVGQAILKFDMLDPIAIQILKQQQLEPLDQGYRLDTWQPQYAGAVAESVFEAFQNAADAKWDPRFRSLLGAKKVVGMLTAGAMGGFIPACTSVMLKDELPVGFCFLLQAGPTTGNIPLVGVRPAEKKRGLGNHLLRFTLERVVEEMLEARIAMVDVTTTMDTDNIPAIKMYRRMGFREEYNYPHVYLTREKAASYVPGKWC